MSFFFFYISLKFCLFHWSFQRTSFIDIVYCLFSLSLIFTLIFIISFILPNLVYFILLFIVSCHGTYIDLRLTLSNVFNGIICPLSTSLAVSYKVWNTVFSFSFNWMHFLKCPLRLPLWSMCNVEMFCLVSKCLDIFLFFKINF